MSNTPNEGPYSNQDPAQNYGSTPQPPNYGPPQQGPQGQYGPPPNYPPQGPQGQYGPPPNYPPQGQYGMPPNYPPQGQYGYRANPEYDLNVQAGPGYGNNNPFMPPASTPLPLGAAIRQLPGQYIRVLTKPGAATFAYEQGKAAWNSVWIQILVLTLCTVLFGFAIVGVTLTATLNAQNLPASSLGTIRGVLGFLPFSYILLTPIGLFISLGIYHLIAKAFGGKGTFLAYMYSYLLFGVPLLIVSFLLALVPILGGLIGSVVSIYIIILQIFMTMGVHRLSGGKATFAVLLLPIIGIVLGIIGGIVLFTILVSAFQHVR